MKIPKYALLETERRFLVAEPPDLSSAPFRLIEDLYVTSSRLRLRAITHPDGTREFKFCKKYETEDPVAGPMVNIYLSAQEHALLSMLSGRTVRKRRYRIAWRTTGFGLDVFEGPLTGLVLCEVEAVSLDLVMAVPAPPWASVEVTSDPFFTGASLAATTAEALRARLHRDQ